MKKSSEHKHGSADQLLEATLIIDPSGQIVAANLPAGELFGYDLDNLNRLRVWDLVDPAQDKAIAELGGAIRGGKPVRLECNLVTRDRTSLPVEITGRGLDDDTFEVVLRDLRKQKRASEAASRQAAILKAVVYATEQLLKSNHRAAAVDKVLARLGSTADVSRVYIFENQVGEDKMLSTSQRFEWTAEGVPSQMGNQQLQNADFNEEGWRLLHDTLSLGEILQGNVRSLPKAERGILSAQGILSIVIVPIYVNGGFWGFIGFDECRSERDWKPAELDALRAAANVLGAIFQRRKMELALHLSEERYRALIEKQGKSAG